METEIDILFAASRGNLSRYRDHKAWVYTVNHRRINKKKVLDLMRRGFLEPNKVGLPGISERIEITVKGRAAMATREVSLRPGGTQ